MRTLLLTLSFCAVASSGFAQDRRFADLTPYFVVVGGNVADAWTTKQNIDLGLAESNPLMRGAGMPRIIAMKAVSTFGTVLMMRFLEKTDHPRAARVLGYVNGLTMYGAAAYNIKVRP